MRPAASPRREAARWPAPWSRASSRSPSWIIGAPLVGPSAESESTPAPRHRRGARSRRRRRRSRRATPAVISKQADSRRSTRTLGRPRAPGLDEAGPGPADHHVPGPGQVKARFGRRGRSPEIDGGRHPHRDVEAQHETEYALRLGREATPRLRTKEGRLDAHLQRLFRGPTNRDREVGAEKQVWTRAGQKNACSRPRQIHLQVA